MIVFAGLDWLWWALTLAGVFAAGAVPFWMHGRAAAEDAYDRGRDDAEALAAERVEHDGLELTMGPRGARWQTRGHTALLAAPVPAELEPEPAPSWRGPEHAGLAAFVAEMTLRAA